MVDDDPPILEFLDVLLSDAGYKVQLASDGRTAPNLIDRSPPDLILLDLMMPIVSGWDVMRELRSRPEGRDVPVIVISADKHIVDKTREVGADGYLAKPFDIPRLLDAIEERLH